MMEASDSSNYMKTLVFIYMLALPDPKQVAKLILNFIFSVFMNRDQVAQIFRWKKKQL